MQALRDKLVKRADELLDSRGISQPVSGFGPRDTATAVAILVDKALQIDQQTAALTRHEKTDAAD